MSLYKRPNSAHWWVRFVIGGRRVRCSTGTGDRAEAEEFETRLRSRYWREAHLGESFHSFREAVTRYLAEADKRDTEKDRQRLGWFLQNEEFANLPVRDVDRTVIDAARAKLAEGLSRTTVNHYLAVLRALLRKAQAEWGWLESVPKVPMYRRTLPEPRWLTRAEFGRLLRELPPHTADLARFAVATGLRRSNITGLTWDRVDMRRHTAFVPGNQAKAGRGIPVALNADAVAVLKRWQGKDERFVFVYAKRRITQVSTRAWREACIKAGCPGLRFHDLRHTWASWQVQAETPLSVLQEMGGWASFEMVRRYSHLSPGHLRQYAAGSLLATPRKRGGRKRA